MNYTIDEVASKLLQAGNQHAPVKAMLGDGQDGRTRRDAFRVQEEIVRIMIERGDRPVGFKLGNIAKAMQEKFGVDEPDYGRLMASHFRPENLSISESEFIEPFIELEPAFVLKKDLGGANVTVADVISAIDYTVPALEIIDSRITDWNIGILDTIADMGSVGSVIIGAQPRALSEINLSDTPGRIYFDGELVASGNTKEIYGNPISALMWLCRRVHEYGVSFKAGDFILPGSCLAAAKMTPGTEITGLFEGWGEVSFSYTQAD